MWCFDFVGGKTPKLFTPKALRNRIYSSPSEDPDLNKWFFGLRPEQRCKLSFIEDLKETGGHLQALRKGEYRSKNSLAYYLLIWVNIISRLLCAHSVVTRIGIILRSFCLSHSSRLCLADFHFSSSTAVHKGGWRLWRSSFLILRGQGNRALFASSVAL